MMRFRSLPARDTGSEAYAAPLSFHGRGSAAGGCCRRPGSQPCERIIGPDSDDGLRRGWASRTVSTGVLEMTSSRPYLLRAVYEWIADNDLTPQIVVDAQQEQVRSRPPTFVKGRSCSTSPPPRFAGSVSAMSGWSSAPASAAVPFDVVVPVRAVLAIMARENGTGMSFPDSGSDRPPPQPRGRPSLKVVK